jgi:hypothetical protein
MYVLAMRHGGDEILDRNEPEPIVRAHGNALKETRARAAL